MPIASPAQLFRLGKHASRRTQTLHIVVSSLRFEDEDLHDFEQHLMYRHGDTRAYGFPGEQRGPVAAMDLQIRLHPDDTFEVIRAARADFDSDESDE